MASERSTSVALELLELGGWPVTERDRRFIASDGSDRSGYDPNAFARQLESAYRGFFRAAAEGRTFADPAQIKTKYGKTLEANYPEAGQAFLKFAYSYWTLKLITGERTFDPEKSVADSLIAQVEQFVGPVFFPTPGPIRIDPDQREATQRQMIETLGPQIDAADFIRNNPILLRDRGGSTTGCFGLIAILFLAALSAIAA